jgi:hypothetical protein
MKTLTVRQPHATLIAAGFKGNETRSWGTNYRGPLAIHAARRFPARARDLLWEEPFVSALHDAGVPYFGLLYATIPHFEILPLGRVICTVTLVDCYRITAENIPPEPERSFGDYTPGRWAWVLGDVQVLPQPWPVVRGRLGLWEWSPDA